MTASVSRREEYARERDVIAVWLYYHWLSVEYDQDREAVDAAALPQREHWLSLADDLLSNLVLASASSALPDRDETTRDRTGDFDALAYAAWDYCRGVGATGLPTPDLIARALRRADAPEDTPCAETDQEAGNG